LLKKAAELGRKRSCKPIRARSAEVIMPVDRPLPSPVDRHPFFRPTQPSDEPGASTASALLVDKSKT
jgi:hypothetical protein